MLEILEMKILGWPQLLKIKCNWDLNIKPKANKLFKILPLPSSFWGAITILSAGGLAVAGVPMEWSWILLSVAGTNKDSSGDC